MTKVSVKKRVTKEKTKKMRLTLSLIMQVANAIECWTCDSGSMTDCVLFGGPRTCPGHDVSFDLI